MSERPQVPISTALMQVFASVSNSRLFNALNQSSLVIRHASAVAIATFANGALGFVFWWVAAREFSPGSVGIAGAAISIVSLIALIGDFGCSTLLAGEVPRNRKSAPQLISSAILLATGISAILAVGYTFLVWLVGDSAAPYPSLTSLLIILGVGLQAASIAIDSSLVALLEGALRLYRNVLFSVVKLILLAMLVLVAERLPDQTCAIVASWVSGQLLAVAGIIFIARHRLADLVGRPRFAVLKPLIHTAAWHHVVNVVAVAPTLVLPSVINVLLTPEESAPFFAAWMMLNMAIIIPSAYTAVLYSNASRDRSQLVAQFRLSLALSVVCGLAAFVGFYLFSNSLLQVLNSAYPLIVGRDLALMGLCVLFIALKTNYIAVARIRSEMQSAAVLLTAGALLEIGLACLGAIHSGLSGLTAGWLLGMALTATFELPALFSGAQIGWRLPDVSGLLSSRNCLGSVFERQRGAEFYSPERKL